MRKVFVNLAVQAPAVGALDVGKYSDRMLDISRREFDDLVIADRGNQVASSTVATLLGKVDAGVQVDQIALQ